jgi:hypothetical protein
MGVAYRGVAVGIAVVAVAVLIDQPIVEVVEVGKSVESVEVFGSVAVADLLNQEYIVKVRLYFLHTDRNLVLGNMRYRSGGKRGFALPGIDSN